MRTKGLSLFFVVFVVFLINTNTTKASFQNNFKNRIIPVSSVTESYPVVNDIEKKVFGNSYPNEDIYNRLERIEIKVFGSKSKKDLSDRVDDLRADVLGENNNSNDDDSSLSSSYSDKNSYSETYTDTETTENESLNNLLNKLEKQLLNQVYPNDSKQERVARLEKYIFNGSSDGYPMNERIERLTAVVKAQPQNDVFKGVSQLGSNSGIEQGLSLATIILMIVAGLLL